MRGRIWIVREDCYKSIRLDVVPGNIFVERLYGRFGFNFAGIKDLLRGLVFTPLFDLYYDIRLKKVRCDYCHT